MLAGWELAAFVGSCEGVFLFCPRKPARKSREKKGKELKPFLHRCEAAATARLAAAKLAGVRVEAVREEEGGAEVTFAQVRSGNSGTRSGAKRRHSCDQRRRNLPGAAGFMPVQSAGRNACGRKPRIEQAMRGVKPCGRAIGWHRAARRRHVRRCGDLKPCGRAIGWHRAARRRHVRRCGDLKPCSRAIGRHRAARRRHVWRCGDLKPCGRPIARLKSRGNRPAAGRRGGGAGDSCRGQSPRRARRACRPGRRPAPLAMPAARGSPETYAAG